MKITSKRLILLLLCCVFPRQLLPSDLPKNLVVQAAYVENANLTKLLAENFENLNDLRVQRRASGAFSLVFVVKNTGRSFVEFTPVLRLSPSARSDLTLPEMYCHGGKTQFFIMSLYDGQDGVDIKNDPELVATKGLVVK